MALPEISIADWKGFRAWLRASGLRLERRKHTTEQQRRQIRFPGIVQQALSLGVSRIHLYFVLRGDRKSPGLMRRYEALLQANKKAPRK